jgi:hypothetical protein
MKTTLPVISYYHFNGYNWYLGIFRESKIMLVLCKQKHSANTQLCDQVMHNIKQVELTDDAKERKSCGKKSQY